MQDWPELLAGQRIDAVDSESDGGYESTLLGMLSGHWRFSDKAIFSLEFFDMLQQAFAGVFVDDRTNIGSQFAGVANV